MNLLRITILFISASFISSCSGKNSINQAISKATGRLIGNRNTKLNERDQQAMSQSWHKALEFTRSGQTIEWRSKESGHYGSITPIEVFKSSDGRYCRKFTQTIFTGGEPQKTSGSACRQANGQWKLVDNK